MEVGGWEEGGDNLDAGAHRDSTVAHLLLDIVGGEWVDNVAQVNSF